MSDEIRKKTLLEILEEYVEIMKEVEASEGELNELNEELLKINVEELEEKLKNYRFILSSIKTEIELNKESSKRLNSTNKRFEGKIKYLNTFITEALNVYGTTNKAGNKYFKGSGFSVYIKSTQSLNTDSINAETLDNEYIDYNLTIFVNNNDHKDSIDDIIDALNKVIEPLNLEVSKDKIPNNSKLKEHLINNIYYCSNPDCVAYTTSKYSDCTCSDKPKLENNKTPIFK